MTLYKSDQKTVVVQVDDNTSGDVMVPMPVMVPTYEDMFLYHNIYVNVATLRNINKVIYEDDNSSLVSTSTTSSTNTVTTSQRYLYKLLL